MSHAHTQLVLHTESGAQHRTYVDADGTFTLQDVPPGIHMLQPHHINLLFPELRLEVGGRRGALVRASLTNNRNLVLQVPLVIRPALEAQYYEKRKPFDLWGFVKSPYGLMMVFSLFAIVVFPRLKMDPEDYKEFQEQMRTPATGAAEGAPAAVAGSRPAARPRN